MILNGWELYPLGQGAQALGDTEDRTASEEKQKPSWGGLFSL